MLTGKMIRKTSLLAIAAGLALSICNPVLAAETAAGTAITNTIDIGYTSGGHTITIPKAATDTFNVDRKLDFTLVPQDNPTDVSVQANAKGQVLTYLLTNTGNNPTGFDIDLAKTDAGNPIGLTYDGTGSGNYGTYTLYTATAKTGGTNTIYAPAGINRIGPIAPGASVYLKVIASIPSTATQGQKDIFTLTAQALSDSSDTIAVQSTTFGKTTTDTRFADANGTNNETAAEDYSVLSTLLTATKTVSVVSENKAGTFSCSTGTPDSSGQAYIPGACIDYTIKVSNGAGAGLAAQNLNFTDTIPANLTFINVYSKSGVDNVTVSGSTITATVNSLAAGATATLDIRATVN